MTKCVTASDHPDQDLLQVCSSILILSTCITYGATFSYQASYIGEMNAFLSEKFGFTLGIQNANFT